MQENTCCFFGHRTINENEELRDRIIDAVERLIIHKQVDTFLFGSKSQFDSLCLKLVNQIKEKYSHIKRIYVRAEFPYINDDYKTFLLKFYDDTYYPQKVIGAGKAVYVQRNYEMIDNSKYCIVYYEPSVTRKSGTKIALDYAIKKGREIIMLPSK